MPARRVWAVVPAAGRGVRFDSAQVVAPKQYAGLAGSTVLEWSLAALLAEPRVKGVVVVLAAGDERWPAIAASIDNPKLLSTVGGASRQHSVMHGLALLASYADAADWILVHDAARPCLTSTDLTAMIDVLEESDCGDRPFIDGAVLATPVVDTVKREHGGIATETVDRAGLWRALTPQVFRFAQLNRAFAETLRSNRLVTDEAQAMECLGMKATLVPGSPFNIKVTQLKDLELAEQILKSTENTPMRIGQGFDVHAFGEGDHVVLGGVTIAHPRGIVAHSDGDVVIHALCDAVLGALGDGDIGQHFPDTDPQYRGVDSRAFLRGVAVRMQAAGFSLINADITVVAEAPRIAKHRAAMAANLAADLGVSPQLINIKGTTTERLGFIGRGEGLAASAAVLLGGVHRGIGAATR